MLLSEIMNCLERWAPLSLQESYDNSGLQCGAPDQEITGALLALDVTEAVLEEAITSGCNLVVAHHPLIFTGLKKITGANATERILERAIRHQIAVYAIHTNLDHTATGVNHRIATKLGLVRPRILAPLENHLWKLVTYVPQAHAEAVRNALFAAGAGVMGNYDSCSFSSSGEGTFRALAGAQPFTGAPGVLHREAETRLELIFPLHRKQAVLLALRSTHPYEEIAYDLLALQNPWMEAGAGLLGELEEAMPEMEFLTRVKVRMNTALVRHTALTGRSVKKVAVCGGSGFFLLPQAKQAGADVLLTADIKYHQFFEAEGKLLLADVGHFESEQFTGELILDYLQKNLPTFAPRLSKINTNPVHYL